MLKNIRYKSQRRLISLLTLSLFPFCDAVLAACSYPAIFAQCDGQQVTVGPEDVGTVTGYIFYVEGAGSQITANDVTGVADWTAASVDGGALILNGGTYSGNIGVRNGGMVSLSGTTVSWSDPNPRESGSKTDATLAITGGAFATVTDSHLTATSVDWLSAAISVRENGSVTVTRSSITVGTDDGTHIGNEYLRGISVDAFMSGGDTPMSATVTDSTILAQGYRTHAYYIIGTAAAPASLDVTGGSAVTRGDHAHGLELNGDATATLTDTSITSYGPGAAAVSNASLTGSTLTVDHSTLTAEDGPVVLISGNMQMALANGSVINGMNGIAISDATRTESILLPGDPISGPVETSVTVHAGDVTVDADNSVINGTVEHIGDTGSLFLTLKNGSVWTGAATDLNDVVLEQSTWNMAGDSSATSVSNGGNISLASSNGTFNTRTFTGSYHSNGGSLTLNTQLGGDDSPTDKLVIAGDSSGTTSVTVNNVGGKGAQTVNGIEVIKVEGDSSASDFQLAERVSAGAYDYTLNQNTPGIWTLNSTMSAVRPEAGSYIANYVNSNTMFLHRLSDRNRTISRQDSRFQGDSAPLAGNGADDRNALEQNVWLRTTGRRTDSTAADGLIDQRTDESVIQLGSDILRIDRGDDLTVVGLMAGYGRSDTDSRTRETGYTSNSTVDGYSIGTYATWYGDAAQLAGPYVDAWLQYGWYDNQVKGDGTPTERYHSSNWAISLETGYAFTAGHLNQQRIIIEPQIQAGYLFSNTDDHRDANGTLVRGGDNNSFFSRIGARLSAQGESFSPFIEANYLYGDIANSLRYGDQTIQDDTPDSRYELKVGASGRLARNWQIWSSVSGEWGKNDYNGFGGELGVKYIW